MRLSAGCGGCGACFWPCFPAKPRRIASYVRFAVWFVRRIACFVPNWPKRAILRTGSPPPGLHVVHAVGVKAKEGRMCCLGGPAPAAEATALWVLTLRGRSVRTAVGSRERRGLARDSVYALGSHIDSHARFAHHGLAWRRLHALRVRRRSGLLFSPILALYVLRNMPTVLNMRTHRIPRLVGGKRYVYLRQS